MIKIGSKTNPLLYHLPFWVLGFVLGSCDDVVDVDTGSSEPVLNIDAWVTNTAKPQVIYLTLTQDYFDNTNLPPVATGATVSIHDDQGNVFQFIEDTESLDGAYQWIPDGDTGLGLPGTTYTLTVEYNNETFTASCTMGRVPPVDSITLEYIEDDGFFQEEYRAEFWAVDPVGPGDAYWIKTYKNGILMNKPGEINIAYDAGPSAGSGFDGITFVSIIRVGINPMEENDDGMRRSPFYLGDSVYVEINSISNDAFDYLNEVVTQTDKNGGLSELFTATPLANVSTNITNTNSQNGSAVVGFFNVANVSGLGKKFNNADVR